MELSKLKKVRNGHRAHAHKVIKDVEENILSGELDEEKLKAWKDVLTAKLAVLEDLDDKVVEKIPDDDVESEVVSACEFSTKVREKIVSIEYKLNSSSSRKSSEHERPEEAEVVPALDSAEVRPPADTVPVQPVPLNSASSNSHVVKQSVKLPKLTISSFAGDPADYQRFWDSFDAAINSNNSLDEIDKMNYLRGLLEGPAASAISGLALSNANYAIAIDILKERFGNKQIVISSHIDAMLKMSKVVSAQDIDKVRAVHDQIEIHVRGLNSLGVGAETYGTMLIPIIMDKLPEEFRLVISRQIQSDTWGINDVLEAFRNELEAREKCKFVGTRSVTSNVQAKSSPKTAATLHTSNKKPLLCYFCDDDHKTTECTKVTDVKARVAILRKKRKCFLCLKTGHTASSCSSSYKCHNCQGKHHKSICIFAVQRTMRRCHLTMKNQIVPRLCISTATRPFYSRQHRHPFQGQTPLEGR